MLLLKLITKEGRENLSQNRDNGVSTAAIAGSQTQTPSSFFWGEALSALQTEAEANAVH